MNHQRDVMRRRKSKARSVFEGIRLHSDRPRLTVFRSNKFIYAQVIDDRAGHTLASASSREAEMGDAAAAAAAPGPEGGAEGGKNESGKSEGGKSEGGKNKSASKGKVGAAAKVGLAIAERAKKAGVEKVVFDRRHYRYHGRIKALADGARKGGLSF
jgi:large subunit ribosomal protein L18